MKKAKKARLFNFIDVLIVVFAIALLFQITRITKEKRDQAERSLAEVACTFEIKKVDRDYLDNIRVDSSVYFSTDTLLGTLASTDAIPASTVVTNKETGESFVALYPQSVSYSASEGDSLEYEFYDVKLTVNATAKKDGLGYFVDGEKISVGETYLIRLPEFIGEAECTGLFEVENKE